MAIAAAENTMILVMLKLIGKQRHVHLTVGFIDTDNALNSDCDITTRYFITCKSSSIHV